MLLVRPATIMLPKQLYWILLFVVLALALGRGRRDERIAAIICLVGSVATILVSSPWSHRFASVEVGVMVVDFGALLGFVLLALASNRFWPLWVAGFQLTSWIAHFLKAADADLFPRVYAAAERFWIYPIFLAIMIGALRARRYPTGDLDDRFRGPSTAA